MASHPIVTIGGSAGALDPLREIVSRLPADFPASIVVVIHTSPDYPSHLPDILHRDGPLPARHARHEEPLLPGRIYVAPPDHHLLVGLERVRLSRGPKENRSRPSIDVLMRSAAYTHGPNVSGVILSGMLDDGTSGLWAVKQLGGRAIVQHPDDAVFSQMPMSAAREVPVDFILPASSIAGQLQRMTSAAHEERKEPGMNEEDLRRLRLEVSIASGDNAFESGVLNQGSISTFTCPECHGVMVQIREGQVMRFRCHTGHAYTAGSLQGELRASVEAGLWNAVRVLDENVMLLEHLAKHCEEADQAELASAYREEAREAAERARRVRADAMRAAQLRREHVLHATPFGEQSAE